VRKQFAAKMFDICAAAVLRVKLRSQTRHDLYRETRALNSLSANYGRKISKNVRKRLTCYIIIYIFKYCTTRFRANYNIIISILISIILRKKALDRRGGIALNATAVP